MAHGLQPWTMNTIMILRGRAIMATVGMSLSSSQLRAKPKNHELYQVVYQPYTRRQMNSPYILGLEEL